MSFKLRADIEGLKRLYPLLQAVPKGLDTAMARALNKTMTGARTDAVAMILRDYNLKAGVVRGLLRIRKATTKSLWASLNGAGKPGIPMLEMGVLSARGLSAVRKKGLKGVSEKVGLRGRFRPAVGISAEVKKGVRQTFPGFFTATMKTGHVGVFRRREDGRKMKDKNKIAIRERFGPSAIKLLHGPRYDTELQKNIQERWDKNILHEGRHVLRQMGLLK